MSVGTTAAIIGGVTAAVGAGANIVGGITGANTAKTAAQRQADVAKAAGQQVVDTTNANNPAVLQAAKDAGAGATTAASTAATNAATTAAAGGQASIDAANQAGAGVIQSSKEANQALAPYAGAGATAADVLNKGVAVGGEFNKDFTADDFHASPGYQFAVDQGTQALERGAAAHGTVGSGGYLKDLTAFRVGTADQEYQKAFQNFETSMQNKFSNVSGTAGLGLRAATTQGENDIGASKYAGDTSIQANEFGAGQRLNASEFGGNLNTNAAEYAGNQDVNATDLTTGRNIDASKIQGDYATQGANAKAAGDVAAHNSLWGGISAGLNGATNYFGNLNSRPNYISPPPAPQTVPSTYPNIYGNVPPPRVGP